MNNPNEVLRARNGYIWMIVSPFAVIATTLVIASMNYSYSICISDTIDCGWNGAPYLNYLIGLIPSALWYVFLLPNAFHKESTFIRKHGRRALMLAGILWGVALLGLVIELLMPLSGGTLLKMIFFSLFAIWLLQISQLNNFMKENGLKKEDNVNKEDNPKEENDLKSSDHEKSATNSKWIIIIPVGLLAVLFYWNSLDYEVQGNLLMAGAVFLIPVGALLILVAFVWGWMALMSLLTKADIKFFEKNKTNKPAQPDAEVDLKDNSE